MTTTVPTARRVTDTAATVLAVALRAAAVTIVCLLLWATLPRVVGWIPTTVVSDSMAPSIRAGDVVVAMPRDGENVVAGQVALVDDPADTDRLLLHRVTRVTDDGLVTKGDANPAVDRIPVPTGAVRGIGVLRVPVIGLPGVWVTERDWVALSTGLAVLAATGAGIMLTRRYLAEPTDRDPDRGAGADLGTGTGGTEASATSELPTRTLVAVCAVVAAALVAAGSTTPAGASYSADAGNAANALRAGDYDCFATPPSDAVIRFTYDEGDQGAGTVRNSGTGADGRLVGGANRLADGCQGAPAITLDGISGQVETSTAMPAPDTFSVETWFRTTSAGGKLIGFGSARTGGSAAHDRHAYIDESGRLVFGVWADYRAHVVTTAQPVTDGQWHHVVGTMSSTTGLQLYLDGALVGTNPNTALQNYTGYWRIGYDTISGWPGNPENLHFAGDLDGTSVWLRALTAQEATDHAAAGRR